jgi:hypothetical protein
MTGSRNVFASRTPLSVFLLVEIERLVNRLGGNVDVLTDPDTLDVQPVEQRHRHLVRSCPSRHDRRWVVLDAETPWNAAIATMAAATTEPITVLDLGRAS